MKIVLLYELAPDGLPKARTLLPAHQARLKEFHARGVLLMAGPFANPLEGSMALLTTREAAEEFVAGDPFGTGGAVGRWTLREWNEALS